MIASEETEPIVSVVTAIVIKNGIKYTELRKPAAQMECQAVNIRTSYGNIIAVNVYFPPGNDTSRPSVNDLFLRRRNVIIVGDMNAKSPLWGNDIYNARGRDLDDAVNAHKCVVLNTGQGTRQTTTGLMTAIDVSTVFRQLATKCSRATLNNTMGSDHVPIVITANARPDKQLATTPKWNLSKADWNTFREILTEKLVTSSIN